MRKTPKKFTQEKKAVAAVEKTFAVYQEGRITASIKALKLVHHEGTAVLYASGSEIKALIPLYGGMVVTELDETPVQN